MDQVTSLEARYVYLNKLDDLLQQLFGEQYELNKYGDHIEIKASRVLSVEEIKMVTWSR
ncbi:hypothetical protein F4806DRAFT_485131 [Annulohypoxylon nitens]|nr:hypothetical protein F4806DRAFT_485131 [Annulohypoxylon nitens]